MREPATGAALATKSEKSSAAWYAISPPAEMPVRWMAYRHSLTHKCTRTVLVSTGPTGGLLLQVEAERRAQPPTQRGDHAGGAELLVETRLFGHRAAGQGARARAIKKISKSSFKKTLVPQKTKRNGPKGETPKTTQKLKEA